MLAEADVEAAEEEEPLAETEMEEDAPGGTAETEIVSTAETEIDAIAETEIDATAETDTDATAEEDFSPKDVD